MSLHGKVALVTGASSGMGRATALHFAKEGASVVVFARREILLKEVVDEIEAAGGKAVLVVGSASSKADNDRAVHTAVDTFGNLDIAFLNAGGSAFKPLLELEEKDMDAALDLNVKGVLFGMQAVIPVMERAKERNPVVIVTSSTMSTCVKSAASKASGIYTAAKSAANQLVEVAQIEHPDIRFNAILPGVFATSIMGTSDIKVYHDMATEHSLLSRAGDVQEVADFVTFLASDKALFFRGSLLVMDGGFNLK